MSDNKTLRHRTIRAVGWSAAQGWGSQLIGLVIFSILAKLLQPADFGLLAMATVFVAVAGVFMDQGLAQALIQRVELEPEHRDTAFWLNFISGLVLATIGYFSAPLVSAIYSEPDLTPILRALCLTMLLRSGAAVQMALLQRDLQYRTLALRNFLGLIVSGTIGIGLALTGYGVWSLVWQQVTHATILSITLWWLCPWKPSWRFSLKHFRDLYRFGLNIIGINIAGFVNSQSDKFIIGVYLGPTALGYYALAHRLLTIITALLSGVTASVTVPVFSSLQNDTARLREAFMTAVRLSALIAYPAFFGLAVLAPYLLPTLFDPKWTESVSVVQVLAVAGILNATLIFHGNLMVAVGKPHWRLSLNTITALLKLAIFFVVVKYGIVAIAFANVICTYLAAPASLFLVHKLVQLDLRKYARTLSDPLLASLIMAVSVGISTILLKSYFSELAIVVIGITIGVGIYAAISWIFIPTTSREFYSILYRAIGKGRAVSNL